MRKKFQEPSPDKNRARKEEGLEKEMGINRKKRWKQRERERERKGWG